MSLTQKLAEWTKAGLLTADQAAGIERYEAKAQPTVPARDLKADAPKRNWALYGIVGIGITAIGTGIISLIASNWEDIPFAAKLGAYFVLQVALGLGYLKHAKREGSIAREAFLTSFAILLLGGIGLVAQLYHLRSAPYRGVLFWSVLTLPAALMAQSRMLPHIWMIGALTTIGIWVGDGPEATMGRRAMEGVAFVYLMAAVGYWRPPVLRLPEPFRRAALTWGILNLLPGLTLVASLLWAIGGEVGDFWGKHLRHLYIPWLGAVTVVLSLGLSHAAHSKRLVRILALMFIALTAFATFPVLEAGNRPVVGAVLFIVIWGFAAAAAVVSKRRRLYDVCSVVIALRLIVVYFEVFGGLAATGLGLIISGALILAIAYAWHKHRDKIASWMEGHA